MKQPFKTTQDPQDARFVLDLRIAGRTIDVHLFDGDPTTKQGRTLLQLKTIGKVADAMSRAKMWLEDEGFDNLEHELMYEEEACALDDYEMFKRYELRTEFAYEDDEELGFL